MKTRNEFRLIWNLGPIELLHIDAPKRWTGYYAYTQYTYASSYAGQ